MWTLPLSANTSILILGDRADRRGFFVAAIFRGRLAKSRYSMYSGSSLGRICNRLERNFERLEGTHSDWPQPFADQTHYTPVGAFCVTCLATRASSFPLANPDDGPNTLVIFTAILPGVVRNGHHLGTVREFTA